MSQLIIDVIPETERYWVEMIGFVYFFFPLTFFIELLAPFTDLSFNNIFGLESLTSGCVAGVDSAVVGSGLLSAILFPLSRGYWYWVGNISVQSLFRVSGCE